MQAMIKKLHISNYKSIDELDLNCERINVFIGEPNTGKSNILEALDLSFLSWMMGMNETITKVNENNINGKIEKIDLKKYFRIDKAEKLFHLGNLNQPINISHPGFSYDTSLEFRNDKESGKNFFQLNTSGNPRTFFDNDLIPIEPVQFFGSPIKPYRYKSNIQFHDTGNYINRLMPPFGNNLAKVIFHNPDIQEFAKEFAAEYGFEFNINSATNEVNIQLRLNEGLVYTLPFEALAETFKRILFYLSAVTHNNGYVITLDEPDTHAFPAYVGMLADKIIGNASCQFFITTHNPYLLDEFIEKTPKNQLAIFVCGFDKLNKSTIAKRLTDEELSELLDYGVDIFFNVNKYLNDGIEYSA
ncbi:MAG: AAA family ATPase [Parafilimonas sp.]